MVTYADLKSGNLTLSDLVEPLYYIKMKDDIQQYHLNKAKAKGGRK